MAANDGRYWTIQILPSITMINKIIENIDKLISYLNNFSVQNTDEIE